MMNVINIAITELRAREVEFFAQIARNGNVFIQLVLLAEFN